MYDQHKSLILEGGLHNNLYIMKMQVANLVAANIAILDTHSMDTTLLPDRALITHLTSSTGSLNLWHHHLGHFHNNAVTHMANEDLVTGMTISDREALSSLCEPCLEGKQTQEVIRKVTTTHAEHVLSRIHTNVCSPLPIPSHRGYQYFITFIDDSSHYAFISPLWQKSEVGNLLKAFITWAELETGQKVKALRSNGGGEYMATHVQQYLEERGIKHEVTTPDTLQHNGVAERLNCTLMDKSRAMLADAQLPKSYWLKALNYTTLLHNVSPSHSVSTTPSEAFTGTKLNVSQLRVFRCVAHTHIPKKSWDKL